MPNSAISAPPSSGPIAVETPTVVPKKPNALPRSSPRNSVWMKPLTCGVMSPPAKPWSDARDDERERRRRGAAGRAGEHEQRDAGHEHRPPAARVADAAGGHQQQPERERVARDDPLQRVLPAPQAQLDARQGDVDDRDVEQRHEPRDEADAERLPAVGIGLGVG